MLINERAPIGSRNWWPIGLTAISLILGLAYTLFYDPLIRHVSLWAMSGDFWSIFRGAQYVGWGSLGGVYTSGSGIVAFPGMEIVLVPATMLSGALHLTTSFGPFVIAHPTAALLMQPIEMLLTGTVLFATDSLARNMQIALSRRRALCCAVAVLVWPIGAIWGHAEDALAVTFALYSFGAFMDSRWRKCGWLLGFGIAFQPLVLMLVPLLIGASPSGQRFLLAVRSVALSGILLVIAFLGDPSDTYRSVVQQPAFPTLNHPTPWLALSPKLTLVGHSAHSGLSLIKEHGHVAITNSVVAPTVTGGIGRTLYLVVAVALGAYVWKRPQSAVKLIWFAAAILSARCLFESVICSYYVAPPLLFALLMTAMKGTNKFRVSLVIAAALTIFAYSHFGAWVWWPTIVGGLTLMLWLGYPGSHSLARDSSESSQQSTSENLSLIAV